MPAEFVTIAHFRDPSQAHLARGVLESAGIEAHVFGDITGNLEPSFALLGGAGKGGIRLMVREADAAEARALLDESV